MAIAALAVVGLNSIYHPPLSSSMSNCASTHLLSYPPLTPVPPNPHRHQIYLNGIWDFQPALSSPLTPPQQDWGKIRVPGDWRLENAKSVPGVLSRGSGAVWNGFNGKTLGQAWYQQQVQIPPEWAGQRIFLSLERVSTDAQLYINQQACGEVNWPYGAVEITQKIQPGQTNTLSLLVSANHPDQPTVITSNGISTTEAKLDARGLIGEVRLLSLPSPGFISDIFVQPSTRQQQISLAVELTDVKQAGSVDITATMLDEQGQVEQEFSTTHTIQAQNIQTLELTWEWKNPRLWDVDKPNLYTLRLHVKGAGIEDTYDQSFGFREFWIEGKKFYLNSTEIRFRPVYHDDNWQAWPVGVPEVMDGMIAGYQGAGFNLAEVWPWNHDERGRWHFRELFAERADLKGFPIMAPALDGGKPYGPKWYKPDGKAVWEPKMVTELRRYRNHPSVLMWATSGNFFAPKGDDQNPRRIGQRQVEGTLGETWDKLWTFRRAVAEELVATIKQYDPTRPVLIHNGGAVGDVYALNSYLNLIPLQEREEWISEWVKSADMPYMVVEFGTPLHGAMMRGRYGLLTGAKFEPLMTEFAAIYFGKKAYEWETEVYRSQIPKMFIKDQEYQSWQFKAELDFAPAFQQLQSLFSTNTWRSWRTWGITGGMIPWQDGHGWQKLEEGNQRVSLDAMKPGQRGVYLPTIPKYFQNYFQPPGFKIHPGGEAILANNGPTLAWIAGESGNFVAKDHSYEGGRALKKQIVVINDTRESQPFSFQWEVRVDGAVVTTGDQQGVIETAKTLFFPVEVSLPVVRGKVDGVINLTAQVGREEHQDKSEFRVFPAAAPKGLPAIAIIDPIGKTTEMLQSLGYTVTSWDGSSTSALVAVAREVLSQDRSTVNPLFAQLEAFVQGGGRVMIFTQHPEWIHGTLGFRVAPHLSRRVFPLDLTHPVVQGLDEMDLRNWRGESTLVEAYPDTRFGGVKRSPPRDLPWYGWHWGNRGVVSSASMEKPHRSSWRPILESEFDLAYTPLMELDYGRGRVGLTTVDFEDGVASEDPVAKQLLHQAIAYAATAPLSPKAQQVIFIGSDSEAAQLDQWGILYQKSDHLLPEAELGIIGSQVSLEDAALQEYLREGRRLFFLSRTSTSPIVLGIQIGQKQPFGGSLQVPAWEETRGLSASDLRSRTDYPTELITAGGDIASGGLFSRVPVGKGVALFCQLNPQGLDADRLTYFRYTRWRQTRAISQLLANLGATFRVDGEIFQNLQKLPQRAHLSTPILNGFYHPDYRTDFELSDDPYRYSLW